MSLKLTISDIKQIYSLLKQKAQDEYTHGNYAYAWYAMCEAEALIQEFNWEYADEDLEQLLRQLAEQWLPVPSTPSPVTRNLSPVTRNPSPVTDKVVVLDDWCTSYVLVLQYIEALVDAGKEILYITSKDVLSSTRPTIISRIAKYPKLTYRVIPQNSLPIEQWCKDVYGEIISFAPSKIIAHIAPCSLFLPVIARLPENIQTYRSNLDDQLFWLGRSVIDYSLEFRPFGVAVSRERRCLKPEQQLYVPFYPVKDGNPFGGFPELPKGSVIIFSGGDFYKTLDPDFTYWNLVKQVLHDNQKAVLLFATKNGLRTQQEFLERFVKENHLEKQFYFIGFRPDINEVFAHADIFLGTCPVCGSLTSQLAALNHTTILQYYLPNTDDDETEQALNYNNPNLQLSFNDEDAFLAEAKRLINDKEYRKKKADLAYASTIKPEQFNQVFMDAITTNVASCPTKKVDYKEVERRWFWPEQMGFDDHLSYLEPKLKQFGLLHKMPMLWVKYNYQRYFEQKMLNKEWYKYKLGL